MTTPPVPPAVTGEALTDAERASLDQPIKWLSNTLPWHCVASLPDPSIRSRGGWEIASASYPDGHHTLAAIVEAVNALPRLVASLRSAREELGSVLTALRELLPDAIDDWDTTPTLLSMLRLEIADARQAQSAKLATMQMANKTNQAIRDALLAALGREDDGRTQLVEYVAALAAERDQLRGWIDATDAVLVAALPGRSPDRPPADGVRQLAEERDKAQAELAKVRSVERQRAVNILVARAERFAERDGVPGPVSTALVLASNAINRSDEEGADRATE